MIISIPSYRTDDFQAKIKSLNKKIVKMGKSPLRFEFRNTFIKSIETRHHMIGEAFRDDIIKVIHVEFININVDGLETFKRDDKEYRFIGTVNYADGIKSVKCLEDEFINHFNSNSTICDHCHTNRMRKCYYLFADDENNVIRIGSSCAKEYFGIDIASYLSFCVKTFFVYGESEYHGSFAHGFSTVYSHLKHITDDFKNWEKGETTQTLLDSIDKSIIPNSATENDYSDILKYWEEKEAINEFTFNMKECIKKDYCLDRNIGTYAYAIYSAINGIRKKAAEEAIKNTMAECQFADGDKIEMTGTVTYVSSYKNQYGYSTSTVYCIEFKGDDNVYYYMSTSAKGMCYINTGDKITVKGTVNGRKDFREKKRWVLKSPKLINHQVTCR